MKLDLRRIQGGWGEGGEAPQGVCASYSDGRTSWSKRYGAGVGCKNGSFTLRKPKEGGWKWQL